MNFRGVWAMYKREMMRFFRTLMESLMSPVLSTVLYFVVFGAAIGSRIDHVGGVPYAQFIVPGLIMLSVMTQTISNASFGIYLPKFIGTMYELLSAPVSFFEITLGHVGAAATKSMIIGLIILATSMLFVDIQIAHPLIMLLFMFIISLSFSLFGFIIGIWAENFQQLQLIPLLVISPLVFLGGAFYTVDMLPPFWQGVSYFNPIVYLISGFRWAFFGMNDVPLWLSFVAIFGFMIACVGVIGVIFKTGYRLKD